MSSEAGLQTVRVESPRDLTEFIRFPRRLYRGSPRYVPHLEFERREFLSPQKNPFFRHAEAAFFLVRFAGGETLGRISAHVDRNYNGHWGGRTGMFGFFDAVEDGAAAGALLGAAESFLRERGMTEALGPMSFTTNDEVGVLVEGFEALPSFMTPWNFPYYDGLLRGAGYGKARDIYAYEFDHGGETPEFVRRINAKARRSDRITARAIDMKRFGEELELVKRIYNAAWERNWGFVPMADEEIDFLAKNLKPLVDPALVHFAFVDGEPAGFFMAMPDYNQVFRRMDGRLLPFGVLHLLFGRKKISRMRVMVMGVVEKYRNLGVESVLLDDIFSIGPKEAGKRYRTVEMSWILEDNAVTNRICRRICGDPVRTWRLYRKEL